MESPSPNRRFTSEFLTELRTRVRLDTLAADYVDLKPAGPGRLKARCPMHSERTPSFTINIDWGRFHCFGCGADGDIIDFLMQADGVSFVDAVTDLAGRAGMPLPQGTNPDSDTDLQARAQLRAVLESAQTILHQRLLDHPDARDARDFLRSRGFTSTHATEWGIGYNPAGGDTLTAALTAAGHTLDAQTAAGMTKHSDRGPYDAFRGRIVWPLNDPQGRIVGFTGRDLTGRAHGKYVNTAATDLFRKGDLLFGYDKARQQMLRQRQVFIVEGQTDVMAMTAAGVTNTVGASGTAFTTTQADLLASQIGDGGEIVIAFDNDDAGRKAAWALFQACQQCTTNITALDLTGYATKADPCDVRLLGGDDALTAAITARKPALQMLLEADITGSDLTTPEGKVNATEQVRRRLENVRSAVLRREYQSWAADRIGVHTGDIHTTPANTRARETVAAPSTNPPGRLTDAETALAAFVIAHPRTAAQSLDRADTDLYSLFPLVVVGVSSSGVQPHAVGSAR
ncbi:DNA primase [Prescottella subtropica]|uniref:DNA primase n=1 Tax=Prescottella subtropica TaxID=2545757 RepID=UPI0013867C1B|nr:DNA primase [Prescottella subtropica]